MSELLKINVNDHTEKKNGLTYLSWAWAWAEVLKLDPNARWHAVEYSDEHGCARPCMYLPDGSAMVKTEVTIKGETKTCLLPVMDHRNKAIKNPDAFAINTAIMRCLAKAISMHGLGLYIYAGEDLPEGDADDEKARANQRERELKAAADAAIEKFAAGNEWGAYEEVCGITDNEEKLWLWNYLGKSQSALRAAIKRLAEEERKKEVKA